MVPFEGPKLSHRWNGRFFRFSTQLCQPSNQRTKWNCLTVEKVMQTVPMFSRAARKWLQPAFTLNGEITLQSSGSTSFLPRWWAQVVVCRKTSGISFPTPIFVKFGLSLFQKQHECTDWRDVWDALSCVEFLSYRPKRRILQGTQSVPEIW